MIDERRLRNQSARMGTPRNVRMEARLVTQQRKLDRVAEKLLDARAAEKLGKVLSPLARHPTTSVSRELSAADINISEMASALDQLAGDSDSDREADDNVDTAMARLLLEDMPAIPRSVPITDVQVASKSQGRP